MAYPSVLATPCTIRLAKSDEHELVTRLYDASNEEQEVRWERNRKKFRNIETGKRVVLIAERDNAAVGSIQIELIRKNRELADGTTTAHLDALYVALKERRSGIGTALLQAAEELLRDRGFQRVTLGFRHSEHHTVLWDYYTQRGYSFWKEKEDGTTTLFAKTLPKN